MTKFKQFQKPQRSLDEAGMLSSRYNKGLVISQLRALFEYTEESDPIEENNQIFNAWSRVHPDTELRPRFYNVREILKLDYDLYLLTSTFSTMKFESRTYEILQMKSGLMVYFGVPLHKTLVESAGGLEMISRLILLGGINALIKLAHTFIIKIDSIESADNIKANIKLLEALSKGMLLEGMI